MQYESTEFEEAQEFLFGQLGDEPIPAVCVEHERFIPCRVCMYHTVATRPYSDSPEDVERVRAVQSQDA